MKYRIPQDHSKQQTILIIIVTGYHPEKKQKNRLEFHHISHNTIFKINTYQMKQYLHRTLFLPSKDLARHRRVHHSPFGVLP